MTSRILVVCAANVCRSPSAELRLGERLGAAGMDMVTVASAGTHAAADQPWCSEARRFLTLAGTTVAEDAARHGSRPVTTELLHEADLVLAADRSTSAELVRRHPAVRPRLFTIKDAARLAQWVVALPEGQGSSGEVCDRGVRDLPWLVDEMDASRGAVPVALPRQRQRWFGRGRDRSSPLLDDADVPDAHTTDVAHAKTFRELLRAVDGLAAALVSFHEPSRR